jgi:hypothetical protein
VSNAGRWAPAMVALGSGALAACSLAFRYDKKVDDGAGGATQASSTASSAKASASSASSSSGGDPCAGKPDKCDGKCVDLKTDSDHCLVCDVKCNPDRICVDGNCLYPPSCNALRKSRPALKSGVYMIDPTSFSPYKVYCDMESDGGGWTLLMKVSGEPTGKFGYFGNWETNFPVNPEFPDFDNVEAKLQSCLDMPLQALRVGMTVAGTTRWAVIPFVSTGLCGFFKSNMHVAAMSDEKVWAKLLPNPDTYSGCIVEGVNVPGVVRLGVAMRATANTNCTPSEAAIGFGFNPNWEVGGNAGNADHTKMKLTKAFGYIMAR